MSLSFKDCNQHNNPYCVRLNYGGKLKATLESCRRFRSFRFWQLSVRIKVLRQYKYFSNSIFKAQYVIHRRISELLKV